VLHIPPPLLCLEPYKCAVIAFKASAWMRPTKCQRIASKLPFSPLIFNVTLTVKL
jgi:hypothetical protein